jgi:hypothetical protein
MIPTYDNAAMIRRVGAKWKAGNDTYSMALQLAMPETIIESYLHQYLHWKRVGHPSLQGTLLRTGDSNVNSSKDQDQTAQRKRGHAVGQGKHHVPAVVLPQPQETGADGRVGTKRR